MGFSRACSNHVVVVFLFIKQSKCDGLLLSSGVLIEIGTHSFIGRLRNDDLGFHSSNSFFLPDLFPQCS